MTITHESLIARARLKEILQFVFGTVGELPRTTELSLPLRFLFAARLLPLVHTRANAAKLPLARSNEISQLCAAIGLIQERLRHEFLVIADECRVRGIDIVPLKGIDQLLWGMGLTGELHTRDLDFLIAAEEYGEVSTALRGLGYQQLAGVDRRTGKGIPADASTVLASERLDYYAYHPWTLVVEFPEIAAYLDVLDKYTGSKELFPIYRSDAGTYLLLEVDVHHSLWPGTPRSGISTAPLSCGPRTLQRLSAVDRLSFSGSHMANRLITMDHTSSWGALAYTVGILDSESSVDVVERCGLRAAQVGLAVDWTRASAIIAALAEFVNGNQPFPLIQQSVRHRAMTEFLAHWGHI